VDFQYQEQGIRIFGRWYPILKMRWVEGFTLNAFVRNMLDQPAKLETLSRIWRRMARRLSEASIAHGDLQHGNVLLVPNEGQSLAVKLVDYDGMWVPALATTPSGEVGHAAYQHPQRLREGTYGPEVDRFSLLVIYCGICALAVGGKELWERYDTGDNLLFRPQDFEAPSRSPLFAELLRINDPQVRNLTISLIDALRMPPDQLPHLAELVGREKPTPPTVSAKPVAKSSRSWTAAAIPSTTAAPGGQSSVASPWWSEVATAEPTPMQDIEEEEAKRKQRFSLTPWVAVGSVAACALVGVLWLWALQPSDQSEKTSPQQRVQVQSIAPVRVDTDNPPQGSKPAPDERPLVSPPTPKVTHPNQEVCPSCPKPDEVTAKGIPAPPKPNLSSFQ
jgi:serine/threonine protein kinase